MTTVWLCCMVCIDPWLGLGTAPGVLHLLFFLLMVFMLSLSYYKVSFTCPGFPPPDWQPEIESSDPREPRIAYSICSACDNVKPPRTHHCSICQRCILKFDHHCPWINNCVGYHNYKFYVLFLFYTLVTIVFAQYLIVMRWLMGPSLKDFERISMAVIGILLLLFTFMVGSLLGYHGYLITKNMTTIEYHQMTFRRHRNADIPHTWDIGCWRNFLDVLGPTALLWLLPVGVPGSGLAFPTKGDEPRPGDGEGEGEEIQLTLNPKASREV